MSPASWGLVDANISILFTELPMLDRPAAAREAGFTAIEAWWPFGSAVPGDAEVDGFERAVRDAGVQLVVPERLRRRHAPRVSAASSPGPAVGRSSWTTWTW